MNKKALKITSKLIASLMCTMPILHFNTSAFAKVDYDYSNPIYAEGVDDTFVYDSTDSVITTKTGIERTLPEVTGRYARDQYPIPLENKVPDEKTFELIKEENKEIMDRVEEDIENGTLKKHIAADGQFYGTVSDDVLGVEKKIYINTNSKGSHSLACYVPAGEIATVKLNDEALEYAKKGKIKISVGMTMIDAESYNHNKNEENRMPYLGKRFEVSQSETKVGTPFGGMVYIDIDDSVPSGLKIEAEVSGVIDAPYYDLGKTTDSEWKSAKNAPGLFAEIRTPYLRFAVPSKFIRDIDSLHDALQFWSNVVSISADVMALQYRTKPMTLIFDPYIRAGIAYASVGSWTCNLPPSWAASALNYDMLMKDGNWGLIHEINHHYQRRYYNYYDEWGLGDSDKFGEITNNALSAVSYILYTNIAAYRGEEGTYDWNKVADPYSSLKQQIFEGVEYYKDEPNMGNFVYSTFAHEIGPINFANVVKSTYDGGTFNGISIPAYDYELESKGALTRDDRYDDFAYRLCAAGGRDYTWYMENELRWPLKAETISKIKQLGFKEVIPVQSVYGVGEVGRETGRPFYVPSSGYVFDFQKSLVSPGKVKIVSVSQPKFGTLTERPDGKYDYEPDTSISESEVDEFILTVEVSAGSIVHETQLNCKIGIDYNSSKVEKYNVVKWNIYEALDDIKNHQPYEVSSTSGMRINTDFGDNLARSKGYFVVEESGQYEFQVFGDDRAAFELHLDNGTTYQSVAQDFTDSAEKAYERLDSTNFIVDLEGGKTYRYTLVAKNIGGAGWADVNIRKTSANSEWQPVKQVYSDLKDVGRKTDKSFTMPEPEYVRPPVLAAGNETEVRGMSVLSTPQGVTFNGDPASANEGIKENIVDGDLSTYFHSSYNDNDRTPFPHEYIIDLGGEKSFNNIEIYTRRPWQGQTVGVIGDYEIYIADEYDGKNTDWQMIAYDDTRKNNSSASIDLKIELQPTKAKYLKIKALNNRDGENLTILAEVKLSTTTEVKNVIAQNSSFIQYKGNWTKNSGGAFVNGATYNTTNGYFMYCFEGEESNIYVTQDVEAEMRIDGGRWEKVRLIGSLREPSITLNMPSSGKHVIEVRALGEELALNMISTDGTFYKGKTPPKSNPPVINGADDVEMGIGQVAAFDMRQGVTVSDDLDPLTIDDVKISGKIEIPQAGENKVSELIYSVEDGDKSVAEVNRKITVTNQRPEISGLHEVTIRRDTEFDLKDKVSAFDYEDKDLTYKIVYLTQDLSTLDIGIHEVKYSVEDSDGNVTEALRTINIVASDAPLITGADNVTIKVSEVDDFDKMDGVSYIDDVDTAGLAITVSGDIDKPAPGTNEDYILTYSVTDSDNNTTTVKRVITVTNQRPEIKGLNDISINEGQGSEFDFSEGVSAEDLEDGDLTDLIQLPSIDLSRLTEGIHFAQYIVTDSDGNTTISERKINVLINNIEDEPVIEEDRDSNTVDNDNNSLIVDEKTEIKSEIKNQIDDYKIQTGDRSAIKYLIIMAAAVFLLVVKRKKSVVK